VITVLRSTTSSVPNVQPQEKALATAKEIMSAEEAAELNKQVK
jgi:hypothetical protein